jgi:plastocyanin
MPPEIPLFGRVPNGPLLEAVIATMRIPATLAVLVLLASSGCGGATSFPTASPTPMLPLTPAAPGTSVSIVMGASALTTTAYSPSPLRVALGNSVTWINNDNVTHTSTADGGAWHSLIAPGRTFTRTFTTTGSFPYHCTIHPGMVGTIEVQ